MSLPECNECTIINICLGCMSPRDPEPCFTCGEDQIRILVCDECAVSKPIETKGVSPKEINHADL